MTYKIVTVDYLRYGGGNYTMFPNFAKTVLGYTPLLQDVVMQFVQNQSTPLYYPSNNNLLLSCDNITLPIGEFFWICRLFRFFVFYYFGLQVYQYFSNDFSLPSNDNKTKKEMPIAGLLVFQ